MSFYKSPGVERTALRNKRVNDATAVKATLHLQQWDPVDDDFVLQTLEIPAHEVGEALGRTMYAVIQRRVHLRKTLS